MTKTVSILALVSILLPRGDEDLDKAAAKTAGLTAYAFVATTKVEGAKGGDSTSTAEVKFEKGKPLSIKSGETVAFSQEGVVVVKETDGWKRLDPPAKGEKPDKKDAPIHALRALKAPHEMMKGFGEKLKDVKREDGEGGRTYSGELTPEAARELGAIAKAPGGKGGPDLAFSGTAKVWVNGTGDMTKIEIRTEATGKMRDKEINIRRTCSYELSEAGTATVEVPEEVKKALSN